MNGKVLRRFGIGLCVSVSAMAMLVATGFAAWTMATSKSGSGSLQVNADSEFGFPGLEITGTGFTCGHYRYQSSSAGQTVYVDQGTLNYTVTVVDASQLNTAYTKNGILYATGNLNWSLDADMSQYLTSLKIGGNIVATTYTNGTITFPISLSATNNVSASLVFTFAQALVARYYTQLSSSYFTLTMSGVTQ